MEAPGLHLEIPNSAVYFLSHHMAQPRTTGTEITAIHAINPRIMTEIVTFLMQATSFTC